VIRAVLLGIVLVASLALFTPLCGFVHRCGCRMTEARCNIANETGPHCPWCQHRALAGAVLGTILVAQAGAAWALRKRAPSRQAAGALAAFPVAGVLASALAWLPTDYPHFLVLDARAKLHLGDGPIGCWGKGGKCCHVGGD